VADSAQLDQITAEFRDTVDRIVDQFRKDHATGISSERLQARLTDSLTDSALNREALAGIAAAAIAQVAPRLTVPEASDAR
jgi:hypothetical protein